MKVKKIVEDSNPNKFTGAVTIFRNTLLFLQAL